MPPLDIIDRSVLSNSLVSLVQAAPSLPLVARQAPSSGVSSEVFCTEVSQVVKRLGLESTSIEAGLWLLAGQLERSHAVSQTLHDPDGSYWHAIMHRCEGDYWNSKYWLNMAADHPVKNTLAQLISRSERLLRPLFISHPSASQLTEPNIVSQALVDLVEQQVAGRLQFEQQLQLITWWEWQLLMDHSCRRLGNFKN